VLSRRWAVERTLAWLIAHRRLVRDYERHTALFKRTLSRIPRAMPMAAAASPCRRPLTATFDL
jgi:transposase